MVKPLMQATPKKELSLFDSTCIIVGIIIGAGIYKLAPDIAKGAGNSWGVFAIWAVGGLLSLFGALGYAELATAYPKEGGDYVYLSKAYGKWAGYLFGWGQLAIIRPGDIAIMAFAFATYARAIFDPLKDYPEYSERAFAAAAVIILTLIHILSVREGKWTQNILTTVKALGLLAVFGVALFSKPVTPVVVTETGWQPPLSLALVFVLFCYGGWNEMAYVAAEVKDHRKNIVRALVLGAVTVTVLYLLVNGAFLYSLGYSGLSGSKAVAADAIKTAFPDIGGKLISALVCISALGAVSGLIFTGARISYALGAENWIFRLLGKWNSHTGTPAWALAIQGIIAIVLIAAFGSIIDTIVYTAAPVYTFYLATSLAVIVLRRKEPHIERPYRVTGYPFTTIVFCCICAFLIYSTITFAWGNQPKSLVVLAAVLLLGMVIYCITNRHDSIHNQSNKTL